MAANLTPVLGAAASPALPLLLGAVREGTVLGVFSRATIIGLDTESGPRVISLLAPGAAAVPNGVRLAGADFSGIRAGAPGAIGAGWVRVGRLEVRIVRSWRTRIVLVRPVRSGVAALAAAASAAERGVPLGPVGRLEIALNSSVDSQLDATVDGLVGLGRGLTPGGDDVLAGVLTGLHAVDRADLATRIGDVALRGVAERTTLLSADLLRLAAAGEACLEALAVLRAIHQPDPACVALESDGAGARVTAAVDRLLSIGHTSGADLATGLAMGLMVGQGFVALDEGEAHQTRERMAACIRQTVLQIVRPR